MSPVFLPCVLAHSSRVWCEVVPSRPTLIAPLKDLVPVAQPVPEAAEFATASTATLASRRRPRLLAGVRGIVPSFHSRARATPERVQSEGRNRRGPDGVRSVKHG